MYPCGEAIESRTHLVGYSEMHKEKRDVSEKEMSKIDESDVGEFGTLDNSDNTIATL